VASAFWLGAFGCCCLAYKIKKNKNFKNKKSLKGVLFFWMEQKAPLLESVEVLKSQAERREKRLNNAVVVNSYVGLVFSWISFFVTAGVFYTSPTLTPDKKVFFASILAVCVIGLQVLICVVKSEPVYLLIFTTLITFISALSVGLAVAFVF